MATHDYVIDNSTGANVRADINNALAAIVSNNSGSSEPSTKYAYQWWADTSAGVLKIRNSANNGWVELLQLDGTLTLEDGSASTPALAFRDDLNTGIFSSAADTFNVATGGVERLAIDSSGRVLINATSTSLTPKLQVTAATDAEAVAIFGRSADDISSFSFYENDQSTKLGELQYRQDHVNFRHRVGYIAFATGGTTERMRIDASGRVLIGTLTSATTDSNAHQVLQAVTTAGPNFFLGRNDSDTADNSRLGTINFGANHGGTYHEIVTIRAAADAQHASNSKASRLELYTTASGNTQATERLRIDSSGRVLIGSTSADDAAQMLKVARTSGTARLAIQAANDSSSQLDFADVADADIGRIQYNHSNNSMALFTDNHEGLRIDNEQAVRIGADEVSGTNYRTKISSESGQTYALILGEKGGQGMLIACRLDGAGSNTAAIRFADGPGAASVATIGVTSTTVTYGTGSSDRTMKKNFENWTETVLTKFKNLNPQKFNYLVEDDGAEKSKGYIAQDLVDDFPEAYPKDAETDKYFFNPSGMVVYLMKAIQELESKVAALEAA